MHLAEIIQQRIEVLPNHLQSELINYIYFLEQKAEQQVAPEESDTLKRRARLKAALNNLIKLKTFHDICDPITWQQKQRQDRELPKREQRQDQDLPGRSK